MKEEEVLAELEEIAKRHRGILKAEDVVEYAQNAKTHLHSKFNWDDSEAAHQWRLHQARNLIRVMVVYFEEDKTNHRVFVSLTPDREEREGGGYRSLVMVMSDEKKREQLLADAKKDWEIFKSKYYMLRELAKIFEEVDKAFKGKHSLPTTTKKKRAELTANV